MPQSDAYRPNWKKIYAIPAVVGFDSSFDSERPFVTNFLPKLVNKKPIRLVDTSEDFLSSCTTNIIKLGYVTLTGLPGETVQAYLGRVHSLVDSWPDLHTF